MCNDHDLLPKLFVLNGTVKATGTTADLTAGQVGLYDINTHAVVTAENAASHPAAYIGQGSFYASDRLGIHHGGYKESIKSPAPTKGINPKNVKRFYKVEAAPAQDLKVRLFWDGASTDVENVFKCGKTYYMRLELKGEPILRYINRFLYKQFGAFTGCCADDCSAGCTDAAADAALVMLDYAKQINNDPLFKNFIKVTPQYNNAGTPTEVTASYVSPTDPATKATVIAGLLVEVDYSETVFADCSFNQSDYYNNSFVDILASMVYQNDDVCEGGEVRMNSITGEHFYTTQAFKLAKGLGETVLREFIASQTQSGIFFSGMPRDRETTGNIALKAVTRASLYTRYFLIYSVAQTGNPSNALSQDQYILSFVAPVAVDLAAFETLMLTWLQAHNPGLLLEVEAGPSI